MRIRHKISRDEIDGCEPCSGGFVNHTLRAVFPVSEFEEVVKETWRDVTGECEVDKEWIGSGSSTILHNKDKNVFYKPNGYRLRKVNLYGPNSCAFIIEKREP